LFNQTCLLIQLWLFFFRSYWNVENLWACEITTHFEVIRKLKQVQLKEKLIFDKIMIDIVQIFYFIAFYVLLRYLICPTYLDLNTFKVHAWDYNGIFYFRCSLQAQCDMYLKYYKSRRDKIDFRHRVQNRIVPHFLYQFLRLLVDQFRAYSAMVIRHKIAFLYSEMTVNPPYFPRQLASLIYFNLRRPTSDT